MKNKEKYAKEIVEIATMGETIALDKKNGELRTCSELQCDECAFYASCYEKRKIWAESECVKKIKLTQAEKAILESIDRAYEWIARDENNNLFVYLKKPLKGRVAWVGINWCGLNAFCHLFQFIKWEDNETYNIQWLLENSEVE